MARKATPAKPESRILSVDDMRLAIKKLTRRLQEVSNLDPMKPDAWDGQAGAVRTKIGDTMAEIFGQGTDEYRRWIIYSFDNGPLSFGGDFGGPEDRRRYWVEGVASAKTKLQTCIEMLKEKIEDAGGEVEEEGAQADTRTAPAADRIVRLDHNSVQYNDVTSRLSEIREEIRGGNEPDHRRTEAEIMASIALLKAPEVRADIFERLVVPALIWVSQQFAGKSVGTIATALLKALAAWFGFTLPL